MEPKDIARIFRSSLLARADKYLALIAHNRKTSKASAYRLYGRSDVDHCIEHRGLVETINAKDRKQHLLDVWYNRLEGETKFCVETTIEAEDEGLHSFYYFNDLPPSQNDFEKTIGSYLTFEFNMVMQGKQHLCNDEELNIKKRIAS